MPRKGFLMSASPVTPDAVNLDLLSEMDENALWARLPQDNIENLNLYLAACDGCEDSLEKMRDKVLTRWVDALNIPEA